MQIIVTENYEEMSQKAAEIVAEQIINKHDTILGLATGSTPVGTYQKLADMNKEGKLDFSKVKTFNLDEYYPIKNDDEQSYITFMKENFFSKINIDLANTNIPNGEATDAEKECKEYDERIKAAGGIDLQILGIGQNGHIAFNEPSDELDCYTHVTGLTENTIEANSRFFDSIDQVPTKALTMGMSTILSAKKILMLISGAAKAEVMAKLLDDKITTSVPATLLKTHPDVIVICDKEAYEG